MHGLSSAEWVPIVNGFCGCAEQWSNEVACEDPKPQEIVNGKYRIRFIHNIRYGYNWLVCYGGCGAVPDSAGCSIPAQYGFTVKRSCSLHAYAGLYCTGCNNPNCKMTGWLVAGSYAIDEWKCPAGSSTDVDGDGHYTPGFCLTPNDDCNDNDPAIFPGAPELCDGNDYNCNGDPDDLCPMNPDADDDDPCKGRRGGL